VPKNEAALRSNHDKYDVNMSLELDTASRLRWTVTSMKMDMAVMRVGHNHGMELLQEE
jgi:hypothetical protein